MKTNLKKLLRQRLSEMKPLMPPELWEIIEDLYLHVNALTTLKAILGVNVFGGKDCSIAVGCLDTVYEEFLKEEKEELLKSQYATFAENALYCQGTKHFLGILTRYRHISTDDYSVIACPDSWCYENDKAVITKEMVDNYRHAERAVHVLIIFKGGVITFNFEERVKFK